MKRPVIWARQAAGFPDYPCHIQEDAHPKNVRKHVFPCAARLTHLSSPYDRLRGQVAQRFQVRVHWTGNGGGFSWIPPTFVTTGEIPHRVQARIQQATQKRNPRDCAAHTIHRRITGNVFAGDDERSAKCDAASTSMPPSPSPAHSSCLSCANLIV